MKNLLFVWPNKDQFGYKPIGLSLLSSMAKNKGWNVELFDTTSVDFGFTDSSKSSEIAKMHKPVKDIEKYDLKKKKIDVKLLLRKTLERFKPEIVAFSVLSDEVLIGKILTKVVKAYDKEIITIWGNKCATLLPRKTLEIADYVCVGEGLCVFPEFLDMVDQNSSNINNIPGIWSKNNETGVGPLLEDLDDLPYLDWDIFDKRHSHKKFSGEMMVGGDHMINWGCVRNCTYCINHFYRNLYKGKHKIRRYSVNRIIEELLYLMRKHKINFFKFWDEDFLLQPVDHLRELSKIYREKIGVPFAITVNSVMVTKEKAKLLKEMNCVSASLGIETGNQWLRKNILNRVDTPKDIVNAFDILNKAEIKTVSFNMLGIPYESRENYDATIKLNRDANVQYPIATFFYPFEGTVLREISIQKDLFNPNKADVFRQGIPALHFKNLTKEELIEMHRVFVLYIKLPEEYHKYIRRSETTDNKGKKLRKLLLDIYDKTVWNNDGWHIDDGNKEMYLQFLDDIGNS